MKGIIIIFCGPMEFILMRFYCNNISDLNIILFNFIFRSLFLQLKILFHFLENECSFQINNNYSIDTFVGFCLCNK